MPTSKCENCGHPEGKHSRGRRGGCAVRVPLRSGGDWAGPPGVFRDCPCGVYRAPDGTAAPTIAELIEQDRARLAADRVSRETTAAGQAGNGEHIGISDHV